MTDTELLDRLDKEIQENGPLTLWDGLGPFPGGPVGRGLSFGPFGRSFRVALHQCFGEDYKKAS